MRGILLLVSILQIINCSCPSGSDIINGQCRGKKETVNVRYDNATNVAVASCKEIQALPVIIHNDEEQLYWKVIPPKTGVRIVLGLTCDANSQPWKWADGSALDYKPPKGSYYSNLDSPCTTTAVWYLDLDQTWWMGSSSNTNNFEIDCISQLPQPPVHSPDGCDNFEVDSDDGFCYQVGITALNSQDAQMICRERGADLASIHNVKENSFVRRLAVSKGNVDNLYLGATYSEKSGKFKWSDGTKWNYDNFYPGTLINSNMSFKFSGFSSVSNCSGFPVSGLGDCLAMDTDGTTGQWANIECSSELSVACKRPQNYSEPLTCTSGPWTEGELIHSPGFPFDASTPCDFILSVEVGKRVQVEILLLEANSCCDNLTIFENYMGGTVIAKLSGVITDELYNTTSSNYARVSWQPNGGVNVRGLLMTFRGVD